MLAHRLRRWPNIKTTLGQWLVFSGLQIYLHDTIQRSCADQADPVAHQVSTTMDLDGIVGRGRRGKENISQAAAQGREVIRFDCYSHGYKCKQQRHLAAVALLKPSQ